VISSAAVGGGLGNAEWVVNAQVARDYTRTDLEKHGAEIAAELDLEGAGVVLFTAVDVRDLSEADADGVYVGATVGVIQPTWAADEVAPQSASPPGTINIVAHLPVAVTEAALVNAVITVTEAKTQALSEAGVRGTGTASDAVCIIAPSGPAVESFAGPRSALGSVLARQTHRAVRNGLG
jgi:adenosylcobinamide hydrolase